MTLRVGPRAGITAALFILAVAPARGDDASASQSKPPANGLDSVQDVMFLTDTRPIFIRMRLGTGDQSFRAAWLDAVKAIHAYLDRDKNGKVTKEEAERGSLPSMVRAATGGSAALPRSELDTNPKDGIVSLEELMDVLRPALGPFRVQFGRLAAERNDALFNHLDRDKDGTVSKEELAAAVKSLHRFDLDGDELIDTNELDPFSNPIAAVDQEQIRRGKYATIPPVIELSADDPSFRPVRLILKKYDKGTSAGEPAGDNRLSIGEFAIDPKDFASADTDGDSSLDTEELRRFLSRVEPDLQVAVTLSGTGSVATIEASGVGAKPLPAGVHVQKLGPGDLELTIGEVSLEFHVDSGERAADSAKGYYTNQFLAADKDNNKYLEKSEVKEQTAFASLFDTMDTDNDGKLYMKEVEAFVDKELMAARSQMVLAVSDQGRAIFAIVDLNRDRRLGVREIRGAVTRVSSWDHDGDGHIRSDEIPHHYQLSIGRGQVAVGGMSAAVERARMGSPGARVPTDGPKWFRKMDRNHDGDISRVEFLGPRADFDRLDRDHDGLIDATEAAGETTKVTKTP
jgi:Ca2+-binding EF-hand superfamily protein